MVVNDPEVVGLGLSTLDILVRLGDMPTWEKGTRLDDVVLDGGGMVSTAMVTAAQMGVRAGYVGTVGDDLFAELKMRGLLASGVDISRVVKRPGPERHVVMVCVHRETGERQFSGLKRPPDVSLRVGELDREYITSAKYLHLDGVHPEAAVQAAKWMHAAGKIVVMDGGACRSNTVAPHLRRLVAHVDILICGSGFASATTGQEGIWDAGRAVLEIGPGVIVQTEGEDGNYTTTAEEEFHISAFDVDVLDTTGAGDVFHGAYIVGLLRGWDLRRIATFASAAAALECTKLGGQVGVPGFEEVMDFLQVRGMFVD